MYREFYQPSTACQSCSLHDDVFLRNPILQPNLLHTFSPHTSDEHDLYDPSSRHLSNPQYFGFPMTKVSSHRFVYSSISSSSSSSSSSGNLSSVCAPSNCLPTYTHLPHSTLRFSSELIGNYLQFVQSDRIVLALAECSLGYPLRFGNTLDGRLRCSNCFFPLTSLSIPLFSSILPSFSSS